MDEEKLRARLQEVISKFIGDADWDGIEHPYWDEDTIGAMVDAAMCVLRAIEATQRKQDEWAG